VPGLVAKNLLCRAQLGKEKLARRRWPRSGAEAVVARRWWRGSRQEVVARRWWPGDAGQGELGGCWLDSFGASSGAGSLLMGQAARGHFLERKPVSAESRFNFLNLAKVGLSQEELPALLRKLPKPQIASILSKIAELSCQGQPASQLSVDLGSAGSTNRFRFAAAIFRRPAHGRSRRRARKLQRSRSGHPVAAF
jgi:hypothetical protein